jgi:hypothetical protein
MYLQYLGSLGIYSFGSEGGLGRYGKRIPLRLCLKTELRISMPLRVLVTEYLQ